MGAFFTRWAEKPEKVSRLLNSKKEKKSLEANHKIKTVFPVKKG